MLKLFADKLLTLLSKRTRIEPSKREIYLYGLDLFLYTLISTSGLIAISALVGRTIEGILIIALYYLNQTLGGGYHATTHFRCFLTMALGLTLALLSMSFQPTRAAINIIVVVAGCILLVFPLKLHKNKKYLSPQITLLRKRSRIAVCVQLVLFFLCGKFVTNALLYSYSLGMVVSVISRMAAIVLAQKNTNENS